MAAVSTLVRVATRKSALALAQASMVADQLALSTGRAPILIPVTTVGDDASGPLAVIGGTGVFVGAVRDAVLAGQADVGVHSLKDLPTTPHEVLVTAAVPKREDPRDALCARDGLRLDSLDIGARIGTGSPRRASQLRSLRPDLNVVDIRGNVDTRLAKVTSGDVDAVVLAYAGLSRLGRTSAVSELLDSKKMLPAPGQGALAVESRPDLEQTDPELFKALIDLDDSQTHAAVIGERAVLHTLEAGCSAPVGALATITSAADAQPEIHLRAVAASVDGLRVIRMFTTGPARDAALVGGQLADDMLAAGAAGLLQEPV